MGVTIVTGASSGIGRSLARRFAADGEATVLMARRKPRLDALAEKIERSGGRALAIECDVTDAARVRDAVRIAEEHFGPITRLVANAGGATPTDASAFTAEHVAAVVDLNLIGAANCIEAVLPGMLERGEGHLVATSSLAGIRGLPASGAYCAAKAGLTCLMESLRIDLRDRGIAVTVIAPGFVRRKRKRKRSAKRRTLRARLRLELETATALMHRAIVKRKPYYAFPRSLVALTTLGWMLPAPIFDRIVEGRGPEPRTGS